MYNEKSPQVCQGKEDVFLKNSTVATSFQSKLTPILIIGYNRPDLLKIILDLIRTESRTVYISIDGPKRVSDKPQVEETLKIANGFASLGTDVQVRNFEENLGCKAHVISAIDWIFENEESAIILEDDIVFNDDFLPTMDTWLERFQADKSVFHLNGYTPLSGEMEKDEIFLSKFLYPANTSLSAPSTSTFKKSIFSIPCC